MVKEVCYCVLPWLMAPIRHRQFGRTRRSPAKPPSLPRSRRLTATTRCLHCRLDENVTPATYRLLPIIVHLPDFIADAPEAKRAAESEWWDRVVTPMQSAIRDAVLSLFASNAITQEQLTKYFTSVTEEEVRHCVLGRRDRPVSRLRTLALGYQSVASRPRHVRRKQLPHDPCVALLRA